MCPRAQEVPQSGLRGAGVACPTEPCPTCGPGRLRPGRKQLRRAPQAAASPATGRRCGPAWQPGGWSWTCRRCEPAIPSLRVGRGLVQQAEGMLGVPRAAQPAGRWGESEKAGAGRPPCRHAAHYSTQRAGTCKRPACAGRTRCAVAGAHSAPCTRAGGPCAAQARCAWVPSKQAPSGSCDLRRTRSTRTSQGPLQRIRCHTCPSYVLRSCHHLLRSVRAALRTRVPDVHGAP